MNEPEVATMSATETAQADARKITPEMLETLNPSDTGIINMVNSGDFIRQFVREVVPKADQGDFYDAKGIVSKKGLERVKNAVIAKVYKDPALVAALVESTEKVAKRVGEAMIVAAPSFAKVQQGIELGELHDLDISMDVGLAMEKLSALRRQGVDLKDWMPQTGLGEDVSPFQKLLVGLLGAHKPTQESLGAPTEKPMIHASTERISDLLLTFNKMVESAGSPEQEGLFGAEKPPTKEELLKRAIEEHQKKGQKGLFAEEEQEPTEHKTRLPKRRAGGVKKTEPTPPELSKAQKFHEKATELVKQRLKEKPVTKRAAKIIRGFKKDKDGKKYGPRHIMDFLVDISKAEMRVGREQISVRHPAHYEVHYHLIRTGAGQATYNTHELGHAFSALIQAADEKASKLLNKGLKPLATWVGSLASKDSGEEGFSEFIRRFVENDAQLANWRHKETILKALDKMLFMVEGKKVSLRQILEDAARAHAHHEARSSRAISRSFNIHRPSRLPTIQQLRFVRDQIFFEMGPRRSAIHHLQRNIYSALKRMNASRKKGLAEARSFFKRIEDTKADVFTAYHSILHVPQEVNRAMGSVKKADAGLRIRQTGEGSSLSGPIRMVLNKLGVPIPKTRDIKHGDWIELTDKSVVQILEPLKGQGELEDFEHYAFRKTELDRWDKKRLEYQGYPGISPNQLSQVVEEYEAQNPEWVEIYAELQAYMDQLVVAALMGGTITPRDAIKMIDAYDHYLPLLRIPERSAYGTRGVLNGAPDPGFRRARGGQAPIGSLVRNIHQRTHDVLGAYYHNRAIVAVINMSNKAATDESLSFEGGKYIARIATRLKLESKPVATLKGGPGADETTGAAIYGEAHKMIADYSNKQLEQQLGRPLEEGEAVSPKEINIHWDYKTIFRMRPPTKAINIVAPLINGERKFYQIEDPILFDLFARSRDPGKILGLISRVGMSLTRPWKRIITQQWAFAIRNLFRDMVTGNFFGDPSDYKSWLPGWYSIGGMILKLTGKTPKGGTQGELLSRSLQTTQSIEHKARVGKFVDMLVEGLYFDNWRDMSVMDWLIEAPGIAMTAFLKPIEIINFLVLGRAGAQFSEEASRARAYKDALDAGKSHEAAQTAYDMITGDFGDPAGSAAMTALYRMPGFVMPTVNITYEVFHRLSHPDPRQRAAYWVKAGPWVALMTTIAWAINKLITPDDKEKELEERLEEDRLSYMVIGGYLRIPFDYGPIGGVQSYTWNTLEGMYTGSPLSKKAGARLILKRAMDLPGHPMGFLQPQLKALIEGQADYRWYFGDKIEAPWMAGRTLEERVFWSTPKVYVLMSKWIRRKTGAEFGPLKIQHFVRAGLAYQLDETIRWIDRKQRGIPDEDPVLGPVGPSTPFIGRLFQREPRGWFSSSVRSLDEIDTAYADLKKRIKLSEETGDMSSRTLKQWKTQLKALETLHKGSLEIDRMWREAKKARDARDWKKVKSIEAEMTVRARQILVEAHAGSRLEQEKLIQIREYQD
jgi:hypothetical protein